MRDKYCNGCKYQMKQADGDHACLYFLRTKRLRGCPAGEGCKHHTNPPDEKKEKKAKKTTKKTKAGKSKYSWDKVTAYKMFKAGKSDAEIGEAVHVCAGTVQRWRLQNGLRRARAQVRGGKT